MTVGFGIVGSGLMAGVHAQAVSDASRTRIVGVTGGSRARDFATRHGIEQVPTLDAMLERRDVDAVILATPHSAHLPQVLDAAAAGKHILLEKPMALDTAECRRMVTACADAGVLLTVGHVSRRMDAPLVARRMIDDGEIGEVRMVQAWRALAGGLPFPNGSWAMDPKEGGPFLDWGSHGCDVVRWYAGAEPVLAFGQYAAEGGTEEVPTSAMAQFTFGNGVMGHLWMTYGLPHAALGARARYLVVGSRAILDIAAYGQVKRSRDDGEWDLVHTSDGFAGPDAGMDYRSPSMRAAFARQVQDLADAITDGTPLAMSAQEGLRAVEMVEAVTRSAATGRAVTMPLD